MLEAHNTCHHSQTVIHIIQQHNQIAIRWVQTTEQYPQPSKSVPTLRENLKKLLK